MVRQAVVTLKDTRGQVIERWTPDLHLQVDEGREQEVEIGNWALSKDEIKLWMPIGFGKAERYVVEVVVLADVSSVFIPLQSMRLTDI